MELRLSKQQARFPDLRISTGLTRAFFNYRILVVNQGGFMNYKRLFLMALYLVVGFVFTKEATAFDKLGVVTLKSSDTPNPNPNLDAVKGK